MVKSPRRPIAPPVPPTAPGEAGYDHGLRLATLDDVAAIERLINLSARGLQAGDYSQAQIEGALGSVFGVDRRLIEDRSYYVVDDDDGLSACGGWSRRRTLFGADGGHGRDDAELDPSHEAAKIRAFFVHPAAARRGLGSALLKACEDAARRAGFSKVELGATLTGMRLYAARGYQPLETLSQPLSNGEQITIVKMSKALV